MPVTVSKQKDGTLTLGGTEFGCQAKTVSIVPPETEDEQPEEVLCGDTLPPEDQPAWKLEVTSIQDFADAAGFTRYTWDNHETQQPFVWSPQGTNGPEFSGDVMVRASTVGGESNRRLEAELSWNITSGKPTWTTSA